MQYHAHPFQITSEDSLFGDTPVQMIEGVPYVTVDDLHPNKTGPSAILTKDWLVCQDCARSIEQRNASALAEQIIQSYLQTDDPAEQTDLQNFKAAITTYCQAFFHQLTTPRCPWPLSVPPNRSAQSDRQVALTLSVCLRENP